MEPRLRHLPPHPLPKNLSLQGGWLDPASKWGTTVHQNQIYQLTCCRIIEVASGWCQTATFGSVGSVLLKGRCMDVRTKFILCSTAKGQTGDETARDSESRHELAIPNQEAIQKDTQAAAMKPRARGVQLGFWVSASSSLSSIW